MHSRFFFKILKLIRIKRKQKAASRQATSEERGGALNTYLVSFCLNERIDFDLLYKVVK